MKQLNHNDAVTTNGILKSELKKQILRMSKTEPRITINYCMEEFPIDATREQFQTVLEEIADEEYYLYQTTRPDVFDFLYIK